MEEFKAKIQSYFDMEDLGDVKYALGIRVTQANPGISLIQDKYIKSLLEDFDIKENKLIVTPLPSNWESLNSMESPVLDISPYHYRRLTGRLQWLVQCTRPDLAFATLFLAQY